MVLPRVSLHRLQTFIRLDVKIANEGVTGTPEPECEEGIIGEKECQFGSARCARGTIHTLRLGSSLPLCPLQLAAQSAAGLGKQWSRRLRSLVTKNERKGQPLASWPFVSGRCPPYAYRSADAATGHLHPGRRVRARFMQRWSRELAPGLAKIADGAAGSFLTVGNKTQNP
jgi:hypothetical protein